MSERAIFLYLSDIRLDRLRGNELGMQEISQLKKSQPDQNIAITKSKGDICLFYTKLNNKKGWSEC